MRTQSVVTALVVATLTAGCGASNPAITPYPHGDAVQLLDGPVHLGDGRAHGQSFPHGGPTAARVCSLVTMPRTADVYVQVRNLRQSETLANVLRINNTSYPLPITLEQDPNGVTPNAMEASPVQKVRLEQGPSMVCLVAGQRPSGDIDDFEVEGLTLFVEGIDTREVYVRRGLPDGAPPGLIPPGKTWGVQQQPYSPAPSAWWAQRGH